MTAMTIPSVQTTDTTIKSIFYLAKHIKTSSSPEAGYEMTPISRLLTIAWILGLYFTHNPAISFILSAVIAHWNIIQLAWCDMALRIIFRDAPPIHRDRRSDSVSRILLFVQTNRCSSYAYLPNKQTTQRQFSPSRKLPMFRDRRSVLGKP